MKYCLLLAGLLGLSVSGFSQVTTVQDGPWNNPATWDCGCVPNFNQDVITLAHRVNIPNGFSVTVDQLEFDNSVPFGGFTGSLVVDLGGTLIVNNGVGDDIRMLYDFSTTATLEVAGTLRLNAGATIVDDDYGNLGTGAGPVTSTTYIVKDGGVHQHVTGTGTSPIPAADWQTGSTCRVVAVNGAAPAIDPAIVFYNFIWDGTGQTAVMNLAGALQNIDGDFTVLGTNNQLLQLATIGSGYTLNIGGNLSIQGNSRFAFTSTAPITVNIGSETTPKNFVITSTSTTANAILVNATATATINVSGDFQKSGASAVNLAAGAAGKTTLNVRGNFVHTTGTLSTGASAGSGGFANINFEGTGISNFASTASITGGVNYTIPAGKTLDLGTSALTGTGTLTSNGVLRVGSLDAAGAVQSGSAGGNIRVTGTRTYAPTSSIIYSGAGAQYMGAGHPSGINTTIANPSGVSLAASVTVADLTLAQGNLSVRTNTLTLGGAVVPNANSIVIVAASSLVVNGTGDITLPITGSTTLTDFTLNRGSGSVNTVYLTNHLTTTGTFTQTNGNLDFRGWILTLSGPVNRTAGTLSVNEYTGVLINGSGAINTLAFSSPAPYTIPTLNTLRLERAGSTPTISGNVKITNTLLLVAGTLTPGSLQLATGSTLTRYDLGAITSTPTAETTYSVVYQTTTDFTTGAELPADPTVLANLTNQGPAVVTLDKNTAVNGTLTLTNGTLNASTRTVTLRGNFVSNSIGNFTASPVIFDGATTISGTTPATFGSVTVNTGKTLTLGPATAPATTVSFSGNITNNGVINGGLSTAVFAGNTTLRNGINGKLLGGFNNVLITGTLALSTVTVAPNPDVDIEKITVSGNWIVNGGTFTPNFSRVDLSGSSQTLITNGSPFYSLYLVGAGTVVLNEALTINNDLFIGAGVTLDVDENNNYTVTIRDDFMVNGIFQGRLGKVIFNNAESQSILRTAGTGTVTLYDLEVNKNSSAQVDLQTNVVIQNSLVLKSATVFAAGSNLLTLASTSDRTAYVGQLPTGASVTGSVIVQRMLPNATGERAYRYISSPVSNSFVSDWKAEVPITGKFSDPSKGSGIVSSNASLFYYDDTFVSSGTALSKRYRAYPASGLSTAAPLRSGVGYSIYIRTAGAQLIDTRGTIGQGNVSIALSARSAGGDDGWNLIGNPYPSPIDWSKVTIPAGMNDAIYVTDNTDNGGTGAGNVLAYAAGIGTGSFNGRLAQGQGFFVRTTVNTTFTFKEADKVDGQAQFFREGEIPNVLRIAVQGEGYKDDAVIRLHDEATDGFDRRFDAYKMSASYLGICSQVNDSTWLAINALSKLDCNKSIPLWISAYKTGSYVIDFTGMSSFDNSVNVYLYDKTANKTINVRETSQYAVTLTANDTTKRFALIMGKPDANLTLAALGEDVCNTNETAHVTLRNTQAGVGYALQFGEQTSEFISGNGGDLQLPVLISSLMAGENELTVLAKSSSCAVLPLTQKPVITVVNKITPVVEEGKTCLAGEVTLHANAPGAAGFRWYEDLTSTTAIVGAETSVFVTPVLNKSKTYYVSAQNTVGCEGDRVAIRANVIIFDTITLGVEGTTFTSSYATGNQWYLDGTLIEGANGATLKAEASGVYTVAVDIKGCSTSASRELTITGETGTTGSEFALFPNPTTDKIKLAIRTSNEVRVTLLSASGIQLTKTTLVNTGNQKEGELDLTTYPVGVYILRIDDGEKLLTRKVTKAK